MYGSTEIIKPINEHIREKRSRIGAWADLQADYPRSNNQNELSNRPKQENK